MVDFGYSLIVDPGGNELLRRAANCDVESHSRLVVNPEEGCYILINGEAAYIDEPGRYEIGTGLSPYFKPIQVLISKGISTYTSTFYFWDVDPHVYRNITFRIPEFCCTDLHSGLLGNCSPQINVSARIEDPERFYRMFKASLWENSAIGTFVQKRVGSWIRQEIYQQCKERPVIDVSGNVCSFADKIQSGLEVFLENLGIKTVDAQIVDFGISPEFYSRLNGFYDKRASANQDIDIVDAVAQRLFNGDMEKTAKYLMMKKSLEGGITEFNPLLWEMAKKYID